MNNSNPETEMPTKNDNEHEIETANSQNSNTAEDGKFFFFILFFLRETICKTVAIWKYLQNLQIQHNHCLPVQIQQIFLPKPIFYWPKWKRMHLKRHHLKVIFSFSCFEVFFFLNSNDNLLVIPL